MPRRRDRRDPEPQTMDTDRNHAQTQRSPPPNREKQSLTSQTYLVHELPGQHLRMPVGIQKRERRRPAPGRRGGRTKNAWLSPSTGGWEAGLLINKTVSDGGKYMPDPQKGQSTSARSRD